MTDHAALSPSARHRWAECPASVREEAKYPDESSAAADDGTHTHTLLDTALKALQPPATFVGKTLTDHVGSFTVDEARAARAAVAYDYVMKRTEGVTSVIICETRVDPVGFTGRFDQSGTVDVQIHLPHELEIIDYKDGMAPVEANAKQLRQYGVGALAEQLPGRFTTIRLTIVQPKLAAKGLPVVSTWVEGVEDFLRVEIPALIAEGAATDKPDAPFVPGDVQCKYCRARNNCQARANAGMAALSLSFPPVQELATVVASGPAIDRPVLAEQAVRSAVPDLASLAAQRDPNTMSNEQLRQILEAAPLIRQVIEGAEDEAEKRMKSGVAIDGLKLVNGRGSRAWAFPEEEMAGKLTSMGIPKGEIYITKLVSPAQAEKLTWTKRDGTKVTLTEKQLKRLESEYIVKMAGKLTVVSAADPRPAVTTDASSLFQPVTPHGHAPGGAPLSADGKPILNPMICASCGGAGFLLNTTTPCPQCTRPEPAPQPTSGDAIPDWMK